MTTNNPTRLNIGMTATINGKRYRIAGRAVLGVVNGGGIYTWNEFNLETEGGESGTLVYEETENGIQWRWFELFDPKQPISAPEAAMKRVGDSVELDDATYHVSHLDRSKVYHIEEKPPIGEKFGSEANYFNAQSGGKLLVVSWTGDQIEFYRGRNLSVGMVAESFNLRAVDLVGFHVATAGRFVRASSWAAPAIILLGAALFFLVLILCLSSPRPRAFVRYAAPDCRLAVGATGRLGTADYQVLFHEKVEIAEKGVFWSRHEFGLQDDSGNLALLIFGFQPNVRDWALLTVFQPTDPATQWEAGNIRLRQVVHFGDMNARVTELFREARISLEGPANFPAIQASAISYGFVARTNQDVILVRWDADTIKFFHGRVLDPKQIESAFPSATKN